MRRSQPLLAVGWLATGLACAGLTPAPPPPPPPVDPTSLARVVAGQLHVRLGPIPSADGAAEPVDGVWRRRVTDPQWLLAAGSTWTVLDGRGTARECPVSEVVALARGAVCPAHAYAVLACPSAPAGPAVAFAPGRPVPPPWVLLSPEPPQRAGAELALANASAWHDVVEASRDSGAAAVRGLAVERFRGKTGDVVLIEGAMTSFGGTKSTWALYFAAGDQLGDQLGPWVKTGRPTGLFDLDGDGLPEILVREGLDLGLRGLDGRDRLGDLLPPCP